MAKRKKRNAITLVSLLLALAALIGVYIWYGNYKTAKEAEEEDTSTIDLAAVDTAQLDSLHVVMNDADLTLKLKDDVWVTEEDLSRPINQDHVEGMLNAIHDISADRIIAESPENLADYGLEEPAATVEAAMTDGSTVTVKIGNEAGSSEGYYGLVNDDGIVYMLPVSMGTAFQYTDLEMTAVADNPNITAENINYIYVDNRDGEDYELKTKTDTSLDNSGNNMYTWEILQPYGEGYTADSTKIADVQSNYSSFDYISCVDYKGENLSLYGLDNPAATIDIGYVVESAATSPTPTTDPSSSEDTSSVTYDSYEYKVSIGNKDENGNYYIMVDGSDSVYTIGADTIDKMLTIDTFSIMNPYVLIPTINNVDQIVVNTGGTTYTMDIEYTTTTNSDGEAETAGTYYYNGTQVEEEAFKSLYQTLISPTYDSEIKDEVNTEGVDPYLTISYHIFGDSERTITASFLPYNDSFCIVKKEDGAHFFVDKRKVDDIAAAISSFTGKTEE